MKKKILFGVFSVAILVSASFFFMSSKPKTIARTLKQIEWQNELPNGMDSAYIANLAGLGFVTPATKTFKYIQARRHWKEEFGLTFIGEDEMTKFLKDNDYIIGETARYLEDIPTVPGNEMLENYYRVKPFVKVHTFTLTHNNLSYTLSEDELSFIPYEGVEVNWVGNFSASGCSDYKSMCMVVRPETIKKYNMPITSFYSFTYGVPKIMIVAPAKKFNVVGMVIEYGVLKAVPPPDPIAVVKVADGYVELAHW